MDSVTDFTMACDATFNSILNTIQLSKLNFAIQVTPFAAYITLKKTTQTDKFGSRATPAPPMFMVLQNTFLELSAAHEKITRLAASLNECESRCSNLDDVNSSLLCKVEILDRDLADSHNRNALLVKQIDKSEQEVVKLKALKNETESKLKNQGTEYFQYVQKNDARINGFRKAEKVKEKQIYNLEKKLENSRNTIQC